MLFCSCKGHAIFRPFNRFYFPECSWQHECWLNVCENLAVPRAGCRSYVTGSIHGWTRLHLTRVVADLKSASSFRSLPKLLLNFLIFSACPTSLSQSPLKFSNASPLPAGNFEDQVTLHCPHGLVFTKQPGMDEKPRLTTTATCGPTATWVYDQSRCWHGNQLFCNNTVAWTIVVEARSVLKITQIVVKGVVIGAGGLGFDSRSGQRRHSRQWLVSSCDVSSELCCPGAISRGDGSLR